MAIIYHWIVVKCANLEEYNHAKERLSADENIVEVKEDLLQKMVSGKTKMTEGVL